MADGDEHSSDDLHDQQVEGQDRLKEVYNVRDPPRMGDHEKKEQEERKRRRR